MAGRKPCPVTHLPVPPAIHALTGPSGRFFLASPPRIGSKEWAARAMMDKASAGGLIAPAQFGWQSKALFKSISHTLHGPIATSKALFDALLSWIALRFEARAFVWLARRPAYRPVASGPTGSPGAEGFLWAADDPSALTVWNPSKWAFLALARSHCMANPKQVSKPLSNVSGLKQPFFGLR